MWLSSPGGQASSDSLKVSTHYQNTFPDICPFLFHFLFSIIISYSSCRFLNDYFKHHIITQCCICLIVFYCLNCYSFDYSETSPLARGRLKCPGHVVVWQEHEMPYSGSCADWLMLFWEVHKALGGVAKLEETGADI